jgi:hypothetical protein
MVRKSAPVIIAANVEAIDRDEQRAAVMINGKLINFDLGREHHFTNKRGRLKATKPEVPSQIGVGTNVTLILEGDQQIQVTKWSPTSSYPVIN